MFLIYQIPLQFKFIQAPDVIHALTFPVVSVSQALLWSANENRNINATSGVLYYTPADMGNILMAMNKQVSGYGFHRLAFDHDKSTIYFSHEGDKGKVNLKL